MFLSKASKLVCLLTMLLGCIAVEGQAPTASIPFKLVKNQIVIAAKVDDSQPLNFIFDSGSGLTVMDKKHLGDRTRIPQVNDFLRTKNVSLRLGPHSMKIKNVYSYDMSFLTESIGISIDGIIGYDLLYKYVVHVDYDRSVLELFDFGDSPEKGNAIRFSLKTSIPTIQAKVILSENESFDDQFFVMTGAGTHLDLNGPGANERDLINKIGEVSSSQVGEGNRKMVYLEGNVEAFVFGNQFISNLPVGISTSKSGIQSDKRVAGILGNRVLKMFNLTFDYLNNKIWFSKNSSYKDDLIAEVAKPETSIIDPIANRNSESKNSIEPSSNYYGVFIGINDYLDEDNVLVDLESPITDAKKLMQLLINKYSFDLESAFLLTNPKRNEILETLEKIADKVTENDHLLIFYAGHGIWDDRLNVGYWLPSNSTSSNKSNWISNSTIRDYISGINSKHTLLISDACFSGSIFKTRSGDLKGLGVYNSTRLKSRRAITSGNIAPVPDKSKFMEYLLKRLEQNDSEFVSAGQIYYQVREAVINNTLNAPQFGVIQNAGDEGGDFVFVRSND